PVGVVGIGARLFVVYLEEGARALARRGRDARERLLDELAAGGAARREVAAELGYSPHEGAIVCGVCGHERSTHDWRASFSAAARSWQACGHALRAHAGCPAANGAALR